MLKGRNKEQYLPQHLPVEELDRLPSSPGVYYFFNAAGKTIYIGKAKNIRKRVKSHFSNNKINRQKQDFLRETHHISFKQCATELMAEILESAEIRRVWPVHNRSQRGYLPRFGLFAYEDMQGYRRLAIEKSRNSYKPIYTFNTLAEGHTRLRELIVEFGLCAKLCNITGETDCGCDSHDAPPRYNEKADEAISWMRKRLPTFALIDKGMDDNEHSCILVKEGNLYGMGYLNNKKEQLKSIDGLLKTLDPLQDNDYIRNLVFRHATEYPEKCVSF
jgi:DNA polymerase-3 subunit epsilon